MFAQRNAHENWTDNKEANRNYILSIKDNSKTIYCPYNMRMKGENLMNANPGFNIKRSNTGDFGEHVCGDWNLDVDACKDNICRVKCPEKFKYVGAQICHNRNIQEREVCDPTKACVMFMEGGCVRKRSLQVNKKSVHVCLLNSVD